ncbi:cilia- and flagella-associated protein 46 [Stegostoma tigrinum]|uniref:cilia- and flagella-associated protein 46 n=1 Tax=Stegostoma tigrinum TaxID=3053191 RepID=UPI00286FFC42|nr:cilia- and flagella-associated protein 46 [Stegostoma tigrinum]
MMLILTTLSIPRPAADCSVLPGQAEPPYGSSVSRYSATGVCAAPKPGAEPAEPLCCRRPRETPTAGMDTTIAHLLAEAAVCGSDFSTLKNAYGLIKVATEERPTLAGVQTVSPDLYVLCAELALQFEQRDISQDCLDMYFKGTLPHNQFLGRAYLCQAELYAPKSSAHVSELNKAIRCILTTVSFAKEEARYHFLVYNASVLYWRIVRPFIKPGYRGHVVVSLLEVIKGLQAIDDMDYEWMAELRIALVECYLDAEKIKDATMFAYSTAEFIQTHVPHMYKKIFSILVYHKLVDLLKVAKEVRGSTKLTAIYRIQRLKSQLEAKETLKDVSVRLSLIYQVLASSKTTSTSASSNQATGQLTESERLSLLLDLTHLALEIKDIEMASKCVSDLLKAERIDKATAMEVECVESELSVLKLGAKSEKCTKGFVKHCLTVIQRIDEVLQNAIRAKNWNLVQIVCITQWKLCLPLFQPNLRKNISKQLTNVASILSDLDSSLSQLRCQVHIEIAQIEEDEERIEVAIEQLKKAYSVCNKGPYEKYITEELHRLQVYSGVYDSPRELEDQAIKMIEQVRRNSNLQHSRSLLIKAGLALASDVFQLVLDGENEAKVFVAQGNIGFIGLLAAKAQNHLKSAQQTHGYLERLGNVDDKLRVRIWADLAKVARKQEVWDVCRTACHFCLLYDDRRWKIENMPAEETIKLNASISEGSMTRSVGNFTRSDGSIIADSSLSIKSPHKVCHSFAALIRILAEVCFINAEATIQLLKSQGVQYNNHAVFPEEKQKELQEFGAKTPESVPQWISYSNWIDSLSSCATKNFLRGAELGMEIDDASIVCNAAIYIWNHNNHLLVAGRYKELVETFRTLLDALKQTGHCGETIFLVTLCNSLCQGLIQPWISSPAPNEKKEVRRSSLSANIKKAPPKKTEKPNIPQTVVVDPEGIPEITEALQICEYILNVTNGNEPSGVVPISVRRQIVVTWVKVKQLLQQQIGPNLGMDDEQSKDSQAPMIQALVALEMYSCNNSNLMKFTVPSLHELEKQILDCTWSDQLLQLEVWIRLMQLANQNNDDSLLMRCAQKAFELNISTASSTDSKMYEKHNYKVQQELLSVAASIKGQSMMKNAAGDSEMRISAIRTFELSASFGEKAGNLKLVMSSAKHFWNCCLCLIPSPLERAVLEEPVKYLLKAIQNTYTKNKKQEEEKEEIITNSKVKQQQLLFAQGALSASVDDPEDDQKLVAALYGLLFHIYVNKGDWKAGLKVLDDAIRDMPRCKQRLLLFKHRIMVNTRLGHGISMDMQKLKDDSEEYVSYMWHRVAVFSKEITDQLTCYQNSIDVLKNPESNWQKINQLIAFGEWLYCNGFPQSDAYCPLDWAVDLLLSMKPSLEIKEEAEDHFAKENQSKIDNLVPTKRQQLIGVQSINTNQSLENLQDVRQLETLVIAQTIMAIVAGRESCKQHCLMAYGYVMCIWQVSLTAAETVMKQLSIAISTNRTDTGTKSNKSKGKRESAVEAQDKGKLKMLPAVMPTNPEEWANFVCPSEVRDAFKRGSSCSLINKKSFLRPTYSLFYLDLLVKELQAISYTHLTLPILQLADFIASEVLDSKSLSDFYHLRLAQICLELNLRQAAQYHEKIPGSVFIHEAERAKCRQEVAHLKGQRLHAAKENQLTENDNLAETLKDSNKEMKMPTTAPVMNRQKLSGVSVMDVWINKADVLLQLAFYQPARTLLAEAHMVAKEFQDKANLAKVLYLLAVLANCEKNHGQAKLLLKEAQSIGGNEYFWYDTITCLICAIQGENLENSKEQACNILKQGIAKYQTVLEERPHRHSVLKFMITSMEAKLESIEIEFMKTLGYSYLRKPENMQKLSSACAKMEQFANIMLHYGYREESVDVMREHADILIMLAKHSEEEETKHRHLLNAYSLITKAILIEEEAFSDLMSLMPLKALTNLSLPLMRKLASLKLIFVQLSLNILNLVIMKDKREAEAARRKGLLQLIVEEFISSTPDYTPVEKEWVTVARSLGQKALAQLASAHNLSNGSEEIRSKCLYLTGKCLRLLAVKVDPINPGFDWVQQMLHDLEENNDDLPKQAKFTKDDEQIESKPIDFQLSAEEESEQVESKSESPAFQLSTYQIGKCAAKAVHLKKERAIARVYFAHASEVLIQSMNLALNNQLTDILAAASLDMVECFGQFDPVSASQYLALHQSCTASVMMKDVLMKAGFDTSSSQLAALAHLQQRLQEDGTMKNMLKTVNERLSTKFKAWKNVTIQLQHLNFMSEFPSNFNIFVLQHSEDRSMLYGALLEKPKSKSMDKKGKGNQNPSPTQARIVRTSVCPELFSNILTRVSRYKQKLAQYLVKLEYQRNYKMQRQDEFQHLQKDSNLDVVVKNTVGLELSLDADFSSIIASMEDYLNPVLSQFDFTFSPQQSSPVAGADSAKSKPKRKEEKSVGEKSTPGHSQDLGEFVILLADKLLLELPLEVLSVLQEDAITSVSRDFSLQLLYNRQHRDALDTVYKETKSPKAKGDHKKAIKMVPVNRVVPSSCFPVNTHNFRYIVDPYDETSDSGAFSPVKVMTDIIEKYSSKFTARWDGIMGIEYVPSHADWEEMLRSCNAFVFYGTERFLANVLPSKIITMNLPECQLMIILDLAQTCQSFRHQSVLDRPKSAMQLSMEKQMDAAILLSLTGVRSIMMNQWHSTLRDNAKTFNKLAKNLLEVGKTTGQTILEIIKSGAENERTNDNQLPPKNSDALVEDDSLSGHPTSLARDHSEELHSLQTAFNFILYGLPNLIVT